MEKFASVESMGKEDAQKHEKFLQSNSLSSADLMSLSPLARKLGGDVALAVTLGEFTVETAIRGISKFCDNNCVKPTLKATAEKLVDIVAETKPAESQLLETAEQAEKRLRKPQTSVV